MAKVIPFPNLHKHTSDMVEEIIASRMPHKHPDILKCLKIEMTELVKKYFTNKELSLSVELPRDLSEEQFTAVEKGIQKTIAEHNRWTNRRTNQLFLDLCMSRMTICELRHQLRKER